jgi:ankyrin repeat protein
MINLPRSSNSSPPTAVVGGRPQVSGSPPAAGGPAAAATGAVRSPGAASSAHRRLSPRQSPLPPPTNVVGARLPLLDVAEVKRNFAIALADACPLDVSAEHECPVCADVATITPLSLLPCNHRICSECAPKVANSLCPLCRTPFDVASLRRGDLSSIAPFVQAMCRHCKRDVSLDQVHAFKHFCPQRQAAYQRARALVAASTGGAGQRGIRGPPVGGLAVSPGGASLGHAYSPVLAAQTVEALEELEELGHDLNATDRNGRTALHIAYHMHRTDLIEFLRRRGLSPYQPCNLGLTCIDYALYGVRSATSLEFVSATAHANPEMHFHRLSYVLAAQRANDVALDYLCSQLVTSPEPRGPLLREMFNAGITGTAPLTAINVLRKWFAGIEEIVLHASIKHGAVSVFNDTLEKTKASKELATTTSATGSSNTVNATGRAAAAPYWKSAVDLCFSCRDSTTATHRIFTHELFDDKDVQEYLTKRFWTIAHNTPQAQYNHPAIIDWLRSVDVASYKLIVEQRGIVSLPTDSQGTSVFHLACQSRNHALAEHFLDKAGTYLNDENHLNFTPLHYACKGPGDALELSPADGSDAYLTIKLLLDRLNSGNDRWFALFKRSVFSETCLDVADTLGEEVLRTLYPTLTHNSLGPDGKNSLHVAAMTGNDAFVLRWLFDRVGSDQFDVNTSCSEGFHAVHYAAYAGNVEAVRYLLAHHNASLVDANGQTVLHHAAIGGSEAVCRLLLRRGKRWTQQLSARDRDPEGRTALDLASNPTLRMALEDLENAKDAAATSVHDLEAVISPSSSSTESSAVSSDDADEPSSPATSSTATSPRRSPATATDPPSSPLQ